VLSGRPPDIVVSHKKQRVNLCKKYGHLTVRHLRNLVLPPGLVDDLWNVGYHAVLEISTDGVRLGLTKRQVELEAIPSYFEGQVELIYLTRRNSNLIREKILDRGCSRRDYEFMRICDFLQIIKGKNTFLEKDLIEYLKHLINMPGHTCSIFTQIRVKQIELFGLKKDYDDAFYFPRKRENHFSLRREELKPEMISFYHPIFRRTEFLIETFLETKERKLEAIPTYSLKKLIKLFGSFYKPRTIFQNNFEKLYDRVFSIYMLKIDRTMDIPFFFKDSRWKDKRKFPPFQEIDLERLIRLYLINNLKLTEPVQIVSLQKEETDFIDISYKEQQMNFKEIVHLRNILKDIDKYDITRMKDIIVRGKLFTEYFIKHKFDEIYLNRPEFLRFKLTSSIKSLINSTLKGFL